jgi:hypothetical protein
LGASLKPEGSFEFRFSSFKTKSLPRITRMRTDFQGSRYDPDDKLKGRLGHTAMELGECCEIAEE